MAKRLATYYHCPTEFTLAVLGGKWKTVILSYLKERPCRYAELRRLVPRLSDKVLSERLRDLTRSGLVARLEPIRSHTQTYCLTEKGRSLGQLLQQLYAWGLQNAGSFSVRVGAPLEELDAQKNDSPAGRFSTRSHTGPTGARQLSLSVARTSARAIPRSKAE
jgi:DNA-binding HxlR family transcriptional regulator